MSNLNTVGSVAWNLKGIVEESFTTANQNGFADNGDEYIVKFVFGAVSWALNVIDTAPRPMNDPLWDYTPNHWQVWGDV